MLSSFIFKNEPIKMTYLKVMKMYNLAMVLISTRKEILFFCSNLYHTRLNN